MISDYRIGPNVYVSALGQEVENKKSKTGKLALSCVNISRNVMMGVGSITETMGERKERVWEAR